MSKHQNIPKSDFGNRNPVLESWRLRRAGTGGGGGHKSRNAPRGGQRNIQAGYLEEYFAEIEEVGAEMSGTTVDAIDSQEDNVAQPRALNRPFSKKVLGGVIFFHICTISTPR